MKVVPALVGVLGSMTKDFACVHGKTLGGDVGAIKKTTLLWTARILRKALGAGAYAALIKWGVWGGAAGKLF